MLCKLCENIFASPPDFVPIEQLPSGSKQDPLQGRRYHHQPSAHELQLSSITCHLCAIIVETLNNENNKGSIDYTFQEDPPLLVLFTDEIGVYKYLKIIPSTTFPQPLSLTERFYEKFGDNTGSSPSIELAKSWLEACNLENHPSCFLSPPQLDWFPTRVIDVGSPTSNPPIPARLILKSPSLLGTPYVTLSHCWGGSNPALLTESTLAAYQTALPPLPKSFQEACYITRRLGFRYLWIDSLCIIQQQLSLVDWLAEGPLMGAIYKNSSLTISASAAVNSHSGCFRSRNPLSIQPCKLSGTLYPGSEAGDIWVYNNEVRFLDTEPGGKTAKINTRGWVMQERILSPRILHFGTKQIFWDCNSSPACEVFPEGIQTWTGQHWYDEEFKMILSAPTIKNRTWEPSIPASMSEQGLRYADWAFLVDYYSRLELTYGSDKLMAVSALAQEWEGLLGDEYLAGLWRGNLWAQLLWRMDFTETEGRKRCLPYRAPTWSWASLEGGISGVSNPVVTYTLDPRACKAEVEVISAKVEPVEGGHHTGQVVDAKILLRGKVRVAGLKKEVKSRLYRLDDAGLLGGNTPPTLLHPDFDLGNRREVHCLLLVTIYDFHVGSGVAQVSFGLLLSPVQGSLDTYERLGTFKLTGDKCSWFHDCVTQELILI